MDVNLVIGISGLILSISSLVYAIYIRRKSNTEKNLIYEVIPLVPVAEVIKGKGIYSLKVVYEHPDKEPVYIENAYMQFIRFTNFGRVPISKNDLAKTDPLRIEATNGSVLDAFLTSKTRDVCRIELGTPCDTTNNRVTIDINFEFLDYLDGGLVQILSDSKKLQSTIQGTVIGMPNGIQETAIVSGGVEVPNWGCVIGVILEIIALVSVPLIFRNVMGNFDNVWLLGLPILAILTPLLLLLIIMSMISREKFKFPKQLIPPKWYRLGGGLYYPPYKEQALKEQIKLEAEIEELKTQSGDKKKHA